MGYSMHLLMFQGSLPWLLLFLLWQLPQAQSGSGLHCYAQKVGTAS
jgi:hypothetical protein